MIPLQQTTPEFTNATSSFANSTGLLPTIAIFILPLLILMGLMSSARIYHWILETSTTFAKSIEYAIKGIATTIILAVFITPAYLFTQLNTGTRTLIYQAIAGLIIAYIGLVLLGYLGDVAWQRISQHHEEVTGHAPFSGGESDDA